MEEIQAMKGQGIPIVVVSDTHFGRGLHLHSASFHFMSLKPMCRQTLRQEFLEQFDVYLSYLLSRILPDVLFRCLDSVNQHVTPFHDLN